MSSLLRRSVALTGPHVAIATASMAGYTPPRESDGCDAVFIDGGTCQPLVGGSCLFPPCVGLPGETCCTTGAVTCSIVQCCCGTTR